MTSSYIGQKGYTIYKSGLNTQQQDALRKDLTVRPRTGMGQGPVVTFPVYRESSTKFYVPRFYGLKTWDSTGLENRLPPGDPIDVAFTGELRPLQVPVVETYLNSVGGGSGGGLLSLPCGFGKTCLGLYLVSQLRVKTLIIVHKAFLLDQWMERIQMFLPQARIGRIQGNTLNIENCDVVLGMLQSLSMKDYPESTFSSFGLMIIDEVHHISSEVFSRALFKIVTRYTLGLSATMQRKDGTTDVFKMFLGDILYEAKRSRQTDEPAVEVRVFHYRSPHDEEFNDVATDMRGQVMYSRMISKLCDYRPRMMFLVNIIQNLWTENTNQQIMILAHNRSLLQALAESIPQHLPPPITVGFYVGGMKESALKQSENCNVILATYSMAAEALDIATLTTLVMATPKTEIEQAVGRILRAKHSYPLVIDVVDEHAPFQAQFGKRKTFYKKQGYHVVVDDGL